MVIRTHECSLLLWSSLENRPFIRQTTGRALVELAATIKTWYDGSPRYRLTPFRTQCLLKRHRERIPPILCVTEEFTLFAQTSDWVFVADKLVSLVFFVLGPFVATVNAGNAASKIERNAISRIVHMGNRIKRIWHCSLGNLRKYLKSFRCTQDTK